MTRKPDVFDGVRLTKNRKYAVLESLFQDGGATVGAFAELPLEIREVIFEYAMEQCAEEFYVADDAEFEAYAVVCEELPPIAHTCRKTLYECLLVWLRCTLITVKLEFAHHVKTLLPMLPRDSVFTNLRQLEILGITMRCRRDDQDEVLSERFSIPGTTTSDKIDANEPPHGFWRASRLVQQLGGLQRLGLMIGHPQAGHYDRDVYLEAGVEPVPCGMSVRYDFSTMFNGGPNGPSKVEVGWHAAHLTMADGCRRSWLLEGLMEVIRDGVRRSGKRIEVVRAVEEDEEEGSAEAIGLGLGPAPAPAPGLA